MPGLDTNALADLIAELVGDHVDKSIAPLVKQLAEAEARVAQLEEFVTSGPNGAASTTRPTS